MTTRAWLPYPLLTLSLLVMWVLLNGFSVGHLLLGSVIALGASRVMAALQPEPVHIGSWSAVFRLSFKLLYDILRSNIAVTGIILSGRRSKHVAGFIVIPLELRHPMGLALLSCIVTSTPGTAWIEYRAASSKLVIHVLDLYDEEAWIAVIKNRYERLLMEIFE